MKRTIALTAACAAALTLGACSTSGTDDTASPAEPTIASSPSPSETSMAFEIDDRPLEEQLDEAIITGNLAYVEALIAEGVDLEATNSTGDTALLWAAQNGTPEIVTALIEAGADLEAYGGDLLGSRSLQYAVQKGKTDVLEALLEGGTDPNLRNREWDATALMSTGFYRDLESAQILVYYGADLDAVDANGNTAIDWALSQNANDVADFLRDQGAAA